MSKIKCSNCDYFAGPLEGTAYCRYLDQKVPADKEKTRCQHYAQSDLRWRCKNFNAWVTTSIGERDDVCIIGRCIGPCNVIPRNHPERCPKYNDGLGLKNTHQ